MSKYEILTLYGLDQLLKTNDIYSPTGHKMIAIHNGILGGQLFYSHKDEKVYGLCLKEIPLKQEDHKWLEGEYAQSQVRYYMNYQEAIDYLKAKGKWEPVTPSEQESK